MMIFMMFITAFIISTLLIFVNSGLAKNSSFKREKLSAFECGFDPKSSARLPFSLRFYLIALVFLIFDVEITLILPIPIIIPNMTINFIAPLAGFFLFILLGGLGHEWLQGALDWDH